MSKSRDNLINLVKENVSESPGLICSTPVSKIKGEFKNTPKYLISIDNLRIVGYALMKSDERYTEDTFEVRNWYKQPGEQDSKYSSEVYNELEFIKQNSLDPVIELRYTQYKAERIYSK